MVPLREHSARLYIQSEIDDGSLRRVAGRFGPGVDATVGRLKATGAQAVVTIHFLAPRFTVEGARGWLRANGYKPIEFIPAATEVEGSEGAASSYGSLDMAGRVKVQISADPSTPTTFSMIAYSGGPMRVPGWADLVAIDMAGLQLPAFVPVLAADPDQPRLRAGRGEPQAVGNELQIAGTLSPATEGGRLVIERAKEGVEIRAAVDMAVQKTEIVGPDSCVAVNGRELAGPLIVVRRGALCNIALLAVSSSAEVRVSGEATGGEAGTDAPSVVVELLSEERPGESESDSEPLAAAGLDVERAARIGAAHDERNGRAVSLGSDAERAQAEALELLAAWPKLPDEVRQQMLDLIRRAGRE